MKKYSTGNALCFDDILLVPKTSSVKSRHDVDLSMTFGAYNKITLSLPLFAAPMDTVCDVDMCVALDKMGGMGILHRYMPIQELVSKTEHLNSLNTQFGVSLGATKQYLDDAKKLYEAGARFFLVDIANGHNEYAMNAVRSLRDEFSDNVHIMAGNVATREGYISLANAGADSVRVGIGGGSACTTRIVSGHGVPTLSSVLDISDFEMKPNECGVVADGGIRNSGDMVKCFAAGADAVMVGSMLAGTDEAPGDILVDPNGSEVKVFRGMASAQAQKDAIGKVSVAEGVSTTVPYKGSAQHILEHIKGGIGSGCSYSGVSRLKDLHDSAEYVEVSPASLDESKPHSLYSTGTVF